jgi:amidase
VLDYTSVTVPVTNVDKEIDVKDEGFKALSDHDQQIQNDCKFREVATVTMR